VGVFLANLISNNIVLNSAKFTIAFLALLTSAIAMGSALPILQKALHSIDSSFSKSIARLFDWNTMGAIFWSS
jgi:hypothetical protein